MVSCLGQLLRINLSTGQVSIEDVSAEARENFIGGRGLGINYLFREIQAGIDPLGAENKLIFLNGVMGGTNAQGYARWLAMTKSPLTGGIGRA